MKKITPIITELFRFVTLRTPQLLDYQKKKQFFIEHPNPALSAFLNKITNNLDQSRYEVRNATETFNSIQRYDRIRQMNPSLYDFGMRLSRFKKELDVGTLKTAVQEVPLLNKEDGLVIWDNLFYQLIKRNNAMVRQACIIMIRTDNLLRKLNDDNLNNIAHHLYDRERDGLDHKGKLEKFIKRLINAKIIVPQAFSTKKEETSGDNREWSPELKGVNRIGIGVFRKVEQEVCCYVPGEVSHIENVMAREYKERHTRRLTSSELEEEETSDFEIENQTDTTSTTRNELHTEISKVLNKEGGFDTGASLGVSGKYPGGVAEVQADAFLNFAYANSSTESDSAAKTYAEEVTHSALERVLHKIGSKRVSRMLSEYEENNRHGYDNRLGDSHVTGVYRWLDIIYNNRLINYGKRLMVEFLIPEPARLYRESLLATTKPVNTGGDGTDDEDNTLHPPSFYGINGPSSIEGYNTSSSKYFETIAAKYNITVDGPSQQSFDDDHLFTKTGLKKTKPFSDSFSFPVLPEYECTKAFITGEFRHDARNREGTNWIVGAGSKSWRKNIQTKGNNDRIYRIETKTRNPNASNPMDLFDIEDGYTLEFNTPISQTIELNISGDRTLYYNVNINLTFELKAEQYLSWQTTAYDAIMAAYNDLLAAEEAEEAKIEEENEATLEKLKSRNPGTNRTIEQRELQRLAIEMITEPFGLFSMGLDSYDYKTCEDSSDIPQVRQDNDWESYASHVKFFEQAFDWKLMAYLFYPYYWADKCDWYELLQNKEDGDPIFEGFLQSGMARVVIPVRRGFEEAVDYYMETGDIWNGGGLVLDADDDLYLSIDEELSEPEGFVDDEWQTRVPTTLTIIQGDSVFLEDEGLPCCNKLEENDIDTLLRGSQSLLGNVVETCDKESN